MDGQNLDRSRYALIPRTLCFLVNNGKVLLIRLGSSKGDWAGLYNGVGGHVERGESPLQCCRREVIEETELEPHDLRLCGVVTVDSAADLGVGLYIFVGRAQGEPAATDEGQPAWIPIDEVAALPTMEDLPWLLPRALTVYRDQAAPFVAQVRQPAGEPLRIEFS